MSWYSGGNLYASSWTSSNYAGHGILAENAPSTGEDGPALGYKAEWFGSEVRFELITPPSNGTLELYEDTSFIYSGNGTVDNFVLQAYINGAAEAEQTTVNINPAVATTTATAAFTMPQMSVSIQAEPDSQVVVSSVAFTMPQMQVAASANTIVPVFSASVNFTMPQIIISAQGRMHKVDTAKIKIGMPQMQVSIDATQRVGPTTGTYTQPSSRPVNFKLN